MGSIPTTGTIFFPGIADFLRFRGIASLAGRLTAIAADGTFRSLMTQPDGPVSLRYEANNICLDAALPQNLVRSVAPIVRGSPGCAMTAPVTAGLSIRK